MKTLKVGDKVKIPKKCNSCLTNFKDFLEEIIGYKLDYLVVDKVKDKSNSWQVGLKRDDGVVLIDDAFMFEDLEHYEEYNETFNPEAHSSLIIDFDKVETIEEAGNKIFEEDSLLYEELINGTYSYFIDVAFLKRFAIKLAKSDASRNYWYQKFIEEQKPNVQLIDSKQLNK